MTILELNEFNPQYIVNLSQGRFRIKLDNLGFLNGNDMRNLLLSMMLLAMAQPTYAHGPTPQKARESITINAPKAKVWVAVKQFDDIANWHPDLKKSEGDGNNQSGGTRTLTFKNDAILVEELDYYNEAEHEYSYRLKTENTAALPTSSHTVELKVTDGDTAETSLVTLKSRFYRGDTGNTPPENLNDEAAVKAMTQFFKDSLNGLKRKVE